MDFLERFFHISPDGGSGATEALYIAVVSVIVLGLAFRRRLSSLIRRGFLREPGK
jgi:hypothetical protein